MSGYSKGMDKGGKGGKSSSEKGEGKGAAASDEVTISVHAPTGVRCSCGCKKTWISTIRVAWGTRVGALLDTVAPMLQLPAECLSAAVGDNLLHRDDYLIAYVLKVPMVKILMTGPVLDTQAKVLASLATIADEVACECDAEVA